MWRATLASGDPESAWDQFIARYRRLIYSVIRRSVSDEDDVADVFSEVCGDLCRDDLARLERHIDFGKARFSTWLVTVVHHRTIDWLRQRDGRPRVVAPQALTQLQRDIFDQIIVQHRSHVEAYELLHQRSYVDLSFAAFMRELTAMFHDVEQASGKSVAHYMPGPPTPFGQNDLQADDEIVRAESAMRLEAALVTLPHDERLAIQLFIVDELPAATVAQMVGWPNAKAVYNRVYRALSVLRVEAKRLGLEQGAD